MSDSDDSNPNPKGQFLVYSPVVKDSLTTAIDGKSYQTKFYNLDAIIPVGGIIMAQKRPSPTHKHSLSVRQRDLARESVVKNSFTTAVKWQARVLEQTIASNVAEILEA